MQQAVLLIFYDDPWCQPGANVIGTSEYVHMVDALAITGDEGRSSLR